MTALPRVDDFPVVGMIGGGQLARMTQQAAIALGIELRVLAATDTDSAARAIRGVSIDPIYDPELVLAFAQECDVVTFDHEHVPQSILADLVGCGIHVRPGPTALLCAQDKYEMRKTLAAAGLPVPQWVSLPHDEISRDEIAAFGEKVGWPIVVKTSVGGYDGRGVWIAEDVESVEKIIRESPYQPPVWLLEEKVPFIRELAAQVARSPHGQALAYPVVQTTQTNGICTEVIAPAPDLSDDAAIESQRIALKIAQVLEVTGMLAVELFDTGDRILINELAMRPHNSGHWTIDGANTSQFENHLRAVLDLPLGSPAALAPYSVMVNVLGTDKTNTYAAYRHVMARDPRIKIHMYGKEPRAGRKLGHVTAVGSDLPELLERAHHAADYLAGVIDE